MENSYLGETIKILRQHQRISLSELARRAGISKAYLHQIESGKSRDISVFKLQAICRVLGVTIDSMLDHSETELLRKILEENVLHLKMELARAEGELERMNPPTSD